MTLDDEPIVVSDGRETWVVYPDDNAYRMVAEIPPRDDGIVVVDAKLFAAVKGWWYDAALARVDEIANTFAIPWDSLLPTVKEIQDAKPGVISEKLVAVAGYMSMLSQEISRLEAKIHLAKSALEHSINRRLATEGVKGSIGVQTAVIISANKALRAARIDLWEAEALRKRWAVDYDALEVIWKTISRVLSVKLHEPLE